LKLVRYAIARLPAYGFVKIGMGGAVDRNDRVAASDVFAICRARGGNRGNGALAFTFQPTAPKKAGVTTISAV
jgi:hypothetical protein